MPRFTVTGAALPPQADTFGALRAMRDIVLTECLVASVSPFAALSAADATRYGVSRAVFAGRPKDFNSHYLPQCCLWIPEGGEGARLVSASGRATATFEARVLALVDLQPDWYAAEQQILAIRDALWTALLHHARLGGTVPSVASSEARPGRGLCYERIAGSVYRGFEALWRVRQQWTVAGGEVG